jgi:hypothetical protein
MGGAIGPVSRPPPPVSTGRRGSAIGSRFAVFQVRLGSIPETPAARSLVSGPRAVGVVMPRDGGGCGRSKGSLGTYLAPTQDHRRHHRASPRARRHGHARQVGGSIRRSTSRASRSNRPHPRRGRPAEACKVRAPQRRHHRLIRTIGAAPSVLAGPPGPAIIPPPYRKSRASSGQGRGSARIDHGWPCDPRGHTSGHPGPKEGGPVLAGPSRRPVPGVGRV